jgi:hypothetical protein
MLAGRISLALMRALSIDRVPVARLRGLFRINRGRV